MNQCPEIEILSEELVPLLLGKTRKTALVAKLIYKRYHKVSHCFCQRKRFPCFRNPIIRYHWLPHSADDALLLQALQDFSVPYAKEDRMLYLVPCSKAAEYFVARYLTELEPFFVIHEDS